MPALGKGNPIPFKIGGGPSNTEQANTVLKQSVGIGGTSPDGTIRAEWFLAKARGLAASMSDERALNQSFPDLATDFLPVYEEILGTPPAPDDSDQDRRNQNTTLWTLSNTSVTDDLETALQEISENTSIENISRTVTTVTQIGRAFQDETPGDPDASGPPFNIGKQTEWPNYSNEMRCYVNYGVSGTPTALDFKKVEESKNILRDRLPAWVDFQVAQNSTGSAGFLLDIDLLDLGAFD